MTSEPSTRREESAEHVNIVLDIVGGAAAVSRLIGVTPRQVARWHRGINQPNPGNAKLLADLHEVVARGSQLWSDRLVLMDWLTGWNSYLGHATPSEFIRLGRTAEVLVVIDETQSGAYA